MKKLLIIALLLLPHNSHADDKELRTITVQGQAEKEFSPDIANFSVNVLGKSIKREEAKTKHDKMLKTLTEIAKKYKIDDKDLSTGFSSVNPNYEYSNDGKRKFLDYSVQTQINITFRDLTQVAIFQEDLIASGFDNLQGPNYTLDKMFTYNEKVLGEALDNAKQKATNLAARMGEVIDKPIEIKEENVPSYSPRPMMYAKSMAMAEAADSAVAQPAGIMNIRAGVIATFSLK